MQLVSLAEARELGFTHYYTGKPCVHGHASKRYTNSRQCVTCSSIKSAKYIAKSASGEGIVKTCTNCKTSKALSEFAKHSTGKYGVAGKCKECKKIYRDSWYVQNKEQCLEQSAQWAKANAYKKRIYRAKRRAAILNATPSWANIKAIEELYKQAGTLSKTNSIKYEVDHIIPLQGKTVSGLHVHWNLQVIPTAENRSKGNRI